ncbi:hypothetical protein F2Q70_00013161 [Brassica cretica]|uniref:Uncharacterized protein n=1 Tax=Brassica cretica TaxID=69181 RepID=A0A8S9MDT0_BRACR|nr:hypothetical protein F2Q70_00013161 [Brassica cretica]
MIDGSWTSTAQFSGNECDGEYAPTFDLSKLWNRLQGFDCNDQRAACLAELCDKIGEDRDSEDMLPGFQDFLYSTSAESDFRFLNYDCEVFP